MAISEQDKLYGDLIVDFVNAKTTDEAGLAYLDNVAKTLNVPSNGLRKAKEQFTKTKDSIKSLNVHEKKVFDAILSENEYFGKVCELIDEGVYVNQANNNNLLSYEGFDIEENSIAFHENSTIPIEELKDEDELWFEFDISESSKDYVVEVTHLLTNYSVSPDGIGKISDICENIEGEIKATRRLQALKKFISVGKYKELVKLKDDYYVMLKEHDFIKMIQSQLKNMLRQIIENGTIVGNEILTNYIERYNVFRSHITYLELSTDGEIEEKALFMPEYFIESGINARPRRRYEFPIVHYVVSYFKTSKNAEYIKQCPYCEYFFLATSKNRARCYAPECERAYQRDKKRKQRENDPLKYV